MKLLAAVVALAAVRTDSADSANRGPRPPPHLECCGAPLDVELQPLPSKCAATLQAALHPVHANSGRQPPLVGGKGPGTMRGAMHLYHAPGDLRNSGIGPALGAGGQRPAGAHATGATLLSPCRGGGNAHALKLSGRRGEWTCKAVSTDPGHSPGATAAILVTVATGLLSTLVSLPAPCPCPSPVELPFEREIEYDGSQASVPAWA